jgi:hypothetical protein
VGACEFLDFNPQAWTTCGRPNRADFIADANSQTHSAPQGLTDDEIRTRFHQSLEGQATGILEAFLSKVRACFQPRIHQISVAFSSQFRSCFRTLSGIFSAFLGRYFSQ